MEKSKKADYIRVGTGLCGKQQSIPFDPSPMVGAMDRMLG
jgi:hypothetical protein